jgi:hypothetical protein
MSDVRLSAEPGFEGCLLDLRVRAPYIKVFGILNGFGPELEVKTRVFENKSGLTVESLAKAFRRTVHLRGIRLNKL